MLDNLQLISGEAFTAAEHIVEKVVDKISDVVGWVVTPKGNKQYQLEAENYLIEQIKNDSNMPELAKAACISDVRKVLREYRNQQNIFLTALKFLDNSAKPDDLDDDWLAYFFDNAKNISKNEMAIIWGKILAREINEPNRIPKCLIYILSTIDYEDAMAFKKLASFSLVVGEVYCPIIFSSKREVYIKNGLSMGEIINLQNTNLIQYNDLLYTRTINPKDKITYFDVAIDSKGMEKIYIGNVVLSKAGQELMSIITDKQKIDGFVEFVSETIIKEMGGIFEEIKNTVFN